jgi:hypothetical protein
VGSTPARPCRSRLLGHGDVLLHAPCEASVGMSDDPDVVEISRPISPPPSSSFWSSSTLACGASLLLPTGLSKMSESTLHFCAKQRSAYLSQRAQVTQNVARAMQERVVQEEEWGLARQRREVADLYGVVVPVLAELTPDELQVLRLSSKKSARASGGKKCAKNVKVLIR